MERIVIDASVLAKPFLAEDGGDQVLEAVERVQLWAPALIYFEVGNAICRRTRSKGISPLPLVEKLHGLRIRIPETRGWTRRGAEIVERENLSYYDAVYVSIAEELKIALWTADERMARVAGLIGIPLFRAES